MGQIGEPAKSMLLCAVTSRFVEAIDWAASRMSQAWGAVAHQSDSFSFDQTDYYAPSMGEDLQKVFLVFATPFDPADLPDKKWQTNAWEEEYAQQFEGAEPRPINLDPGYLTQAKLVLATTKDRDHRIYLARGIYAEVTLAYRRKQWESQRWTYADYRRPEYHEFFSHCRHSLRHP